MLIIVCGLQGTGKSWVARGIVSRIDAVILRTDVLRFQLYEQPTYTEEEKQRVYDEMFAYAGELIQEGNNVILDATFHQKKNRQKAREVAQKFNIEFKIVEVISRDDVVKERLKHRENDESEAEYHHYLRYKELYEPIEEDHIIIDNSGSQEETLKQIAESFDSN